MQWRDPQPLRGPRRHVHSVMSPRKARERPFASSWNGGRRADHSRCREGGMTAQVHFDCGSEPADMIAVACTYKKGRLRKIVFLSDGLHGFVGEPCFQRHDRGGVALEWRAGKRVQLIDAKLHPLSLQGVLIVEGSPRERAALVLS